MSEPADPTRLKMIRFRAWHRGIRETDLILGGFADRHLAELDPEQLEEFERIMEWPDQQLLAWIIGQEEPPAEARGEVFDWLQRFRLTLT